MHLLVPCLALFSCSCIALPMRERDRDDVVFLPSIDEDGPLELGTFDDFLYSKESHSPSVMHIYEALKKYQPLSDEPLSPVVPKTLGEVFNSEYSQVQQLRDKWLGREITPDLRNKKLPLLKMIPVLARLYDSVKKDITYFGHLHFDYFGEDPVHSFTTTLNDFLKYSRRVRTVVERELSSPFEIKRSDEATLKWTCEKAQEEADDLSRLVANMRYYESLHS